MSFIHRLVIFSLALLPLSAFAQQTAPTDFREVIEMVLRFLQAITGLAWLFLFFFFIYGVMKFLLNFDDERAREEGKKSMVFTFAVTAVVFMIWGIISLLSSSVFGNSMFGFGIPLLSPPVQP